MNRVAMPIESMDNTHETGARYSLSRLLGVRSSRSGRRGRRQAAV